MEYIGRGFLLLTMVVFAVRWAANKFSEGNPEAAAAIKKKAQEKIITVVKGRLE